MKAHIEQHFFYHPRPDAFGYVDGQTWELGGVRVRAIHMPGHTAGHSVLLVEPEGVLFLGDIELSTFGPYYADGCSSLADFRTTLRRVADVPARVWVTSHHKGVITERQTFLDLLRAFGEKIDVRARAILEELGKGPRTLEQLAEHRFLYPKGHQDIWVEDVERMNLRQHLGELTGNGQVVLEGDKYRVARA